MSEKDSAVTPIAGDDEDETAVDRDITAADDDTPIAREEPAPQGRPWWSVIVGSAVTVLAVIAIAVIGISHVNHQRTLDREREKTNAAWDFMELLFSIGDNKAAETKMEQLKLRTADPLHADFENRMAPLFDEFAQFGGAGPLHVTSAAFLTGGPPKQAADTVSGATAVLITASARQSRAGRGNSFWVDVVDGGDGKYLIADLGVAGT
jgi:hypothetical protein